MQDDVSRLVGIDGLVVTGGGRAGRTARACGRAEAGCRLLSVVWRASLKVKDRPVVRVRDLPVAGRVTWLLWRKRRFYCDACGRTFTETHPALPPRQRVTARFRQHLFERCRAGAAHLEVARDERTSCYQVNRAFAVGGDELLGRRDRNR
ncbi:MAG: transposase family protein [Solirubrobacteraceae bacterium]